MTIEQFCDWLAHHGAGEFSRLNIGKPTSAVTRSATIEAAGVKIVVTIGDSTPMQLYLTPEGSERLGLPQTPTVQITPTTATVTPTTPHLKEIEKCILEAAPRADAEPMTMVKLARIAGYACTSHFRGHVARLVDVGLLIRLTGGVRKAQISI